LIAENLGAAPATSTWDPLQHLGSELVADRAVGHLSQAITDEVRVIALCELIECAHHLAVERGTIALQTTDETSVAERHRVDARGTCVGYPNARGERRSILDHYVTSRGRGRVPIGAFLRRDGFQELEQ
jgi:hypothetical protein